MDAGGLRNVVTASATPVNGDPDVSDTSGTDFGNSDPTDTPIPRQPGIAVTKVLNALPDLPSVGDTITYLITVTNTGNVALLEPTLVDDLERYGPYAATLALTSGPDYIGGDTNGNGIFDPREQRLFIATYTLTEDDIRAPEPGNPNGISNTVTASSTTLDGLEPVSDISGLTNDTNEPTTLDLPALPAIQVVKTVPVAPTSLAVGGTIDFLIEVTNTGNVALTNVVVNDTLTRFDTSTISNTVLTNGTGPDYATGIMQPRAVWTYTLSHTITQADIDAGGIANTVLATATDRDGTPVSDISGTTAAGNDPTTVPLPAVSSIAVEKTLASATTPPAGQSLPVTLTFEITVENTGEVTLENIRVTDVMTRTDPAQVISGVPAATFVSSDATDSDLAADSLLSPGETWTYNLVYALTQADIDAKGLSNVATGIGTPLNGDSDVSDSSTSGSGNTAVYEPAYEPGITVTKTTQVPALGELNEEITFVITVENSGNITLQPPSLTDVMTYADGSPLSGAFGAPTLVSPTGKTTFDVDDVWTYHLVYTLTQEDIDKGGVTNTVDVEALTIHSNDPVTGDDSVDIVIAPEPELDVVKIISPMPPMPIAVGDTIPYVVTVENTGNVTLSNVVMSDTLTRTSPDGLLDATFPITLTGPTGDTGVVGELSPEEIWTYTYNHIVTQDDLDAGFLSNVAIATAEDPNGNPVDDDSGTTTGTDNPTDLVLEGETALRVVKTVASPTSPAVSVAGDDVTFEIRVINEGTVGLRDIVLTDDLSDALGNSLGQPVPVFVRGINGPAGMLPAGEEWVFEVTHTLTQSDIDAGGLLNIVTATANDPQNTPITDESNPDPLDDDPVPTPFVVTPEAALDVVKVISPMPPMPVALGDTIPYVVTVQNIGTVTLSNVVMSDTLTRTAPEGTTAITVSLSGPTGDTGTLGELSPNELWSYTYDHVVTQADLDAGFLSNVAIATADDPTGGKVTDQSGTTTGTDDPTDLVLEGEAALRVVKTVANPASPAVSVAGDDVTFEIRVINEGTVGLRDIALTDDLSDALGNSLRQPVPVFVRGTNGPAGILPAGEEWVYNVTHTLTQSDIDAGGLLNIVTATANDPQNTPITDESNPDPLDDDPVPTPFVVTPEAALDVVKVITPMPPMPVAVGTEIPYVVTVQNIGNVTLTDITLVDDMSRISPEETVSLTSPVLVGPTGDTGDDGAMLPDEIWTYTATYVVTQDDLDAGRLSNIVTATGTDPEGNPVTDESGTETNTDTPTIIDLIGVPEMRIVKEVVSPVLTGEPWVAEEGDEVVFRVSVINTGTVNLRDVTLTEDLRRMDGTPIDPAPTLVAEDVAPGPNGELLVGTTWTYLVTHVVTIADIEAEGLSNTVIGTARSPQDPPGEPGTTDTSGPDPETDEPILVPIDGVPVFDVTKVAGTSIALGAGRFELPFTITVTNQGPVAIRNLQVEDDLSTMLGKATLVETRNLQVSGAELGGVNPAYDGLKDIDLLVDGTRVAGMGRLVITFSVVFDITSGMPGEENVAIVESDRTTRERVPAPIPVPTPPAIAATKTADTDTAVIGQTVTYTLGYTNTGDLTQRDLSLVDSLPAGLALVPDSVTLDGTSVTAQVQGRRVTVALASLAAGARAEVVLKARVTALNDSVTNRAWAEDNGGNRLSNEATHTLVQRVEAVFQCSDVIGRVFDDRNLNGYLDRAIDSGSVLSNQGYSREKWEVETQTETTGAEQGLAGIRLFTPTGTVITTDAYGRFSVPCAALPERMGENFTLRLDESSLPTGYRMTSENPRTIRLSQGTLGWMEFGAAVGRVMEIDLTAGAFVNGAPRAELVAGVQSLVEQIANQPVMLRLNYYYGAEGEGAARAHLDAVEDVMRERWNGRGQYRLLIERQIARLQ